MQYFGTMKEDENKKQEKYLQHTANQGIDIH